MTSLRASILRASSLPQGFLRVYEAMPDTQLDVPEAYTLLERIVTLAFQKGVISRDTMRRMPTK